MRRRDVLCGLGGLAASPWFLNLQQRAEAAALEPTPILDFREPLNCVAGVRPYRTNGYRLEVERPSSHPRKFVVHNYGHGGAGITMSWGVATKARDLVQSHLATTSDREVAVLGAGVIGMTTATVLAELGLRVTIYAENFWRKTTSSVAGGQWAPSVVKYRTRDIPQFTEILEISYRRFKDSIGKGFGVTAVPNYAMERHPAFETVLKFSPTLIPQPDILPSLPFEYLTSPGFRYHTVLVEPLIFLNRLDQDLRSAKASFVSRKFLTPAKVFELRENIIINCTGYGAKALWRDNALFPIKGQLALLPPQPKLKYLFGRSGYLFPRKDAVVIGGTFEENDDSTTVDVKRCRQLVNFLKLVFSGVPGPAIAFQETDIDHPKNLKYLGPEAVDE